MIEQDITIDQRHAEMVTKLAKPGAAIVETLNADKAHLLHMAVGVAGEAGELMEGAVLASIAVTDEALGDARQNVVEEMGDIEFYLEGLRQGTGISRDETANADGLDDVMSGLVPEIGIFVYASRALDYVKKHVIYNKELNVDALRESLTGLECHLNNMRLSWGISHTQVLEHVHSKLLSGQKARYKEGYSDKAAQERADKQ